MKILKVTLSAIILVTVLALQGCGGSSDPTPAVSMHLVGGTYYRVDLNVSAANHYDLGRQYALQIQSNVPDYEARIDGSLQYMIGLIQQHDPGFNFAIVNQRAHDLYPNIPPDYQQEIQGMQSVFSYTTDTLGDGRISQDELLVFQLFADVTRLNNCSASAAFGSATPTGTTIAARSLEWKTGTNAYMSAIHAVTMLHNGGNSLVNFGFLGQLSAISAFNSNHVFGATLDSEVYGPFPPTAGKRSYTMDLRYALENATTIQDVANYLTGKNYAFNFNIFLADKNSAGSFENDAVTPFSGLRTATSPLRPTVPAWNYPNAFAMVNSFMLPGAVENFDCADEEKCWPGNPPRWLSFISLYGTALSQGKISMDVMKQITAYPGPLGNGEAVFGAIFRFDIEPALQTIIVDMNTLETWAYFAPAGAPLAGPNYMQVFATSPF